MRQKDFHMHSKSEKGNKATEILIEKEEFIRGLLSCICP